MEITYRQFTKDDQTVLTDLIHRLYVEDPASVPMTDQKIARTIDQLLAHPGMGTIMLLETQDDTVGYAILINFWDNERGGVLVDIDEIYIKQEYRSQGIATAFIEWLRDTKYNDAVLLQLEVTPSNKKARQLYERLGFKAHKNQTMDLEL